MNQHHVCIMTNKSGKLYKGITNNLERRVCEHKMEALRFAQGDRHGVWLYIIRACLKMDQDVIPAQAGICEFLI